MTHAELVSLSHLLRDEHVLSVYIDRSAHDTAQRHAWQVELDNALKAVRQTLEGSSHDERAAFDACVAFLDDQLTRLGGAGGAPGWVAFVTRDGVRHAEALPAPTPTLAVWMTGPCRTPYVRALKQSRPVVVVVADARKASIYVYAGGTLRQAETLHAHAVTEPPLHMGNPPRPGFHGGTRGATGHDSAQRRLAQGTNRMVEKAARQAVTLAGVDGWIIAGGISHVARQVTRAITRLARDRVLQLESLDVHATEADVTAAAQASASDLRDAADLHHVAELIAGAEGNGAASLGPDATRYALEQGCVRELYFTDRYVRDHAMPAEEAVRAALDQGAVVEEVSRAVASRLDERGGICARLRYPLATAGASVAIEPGVHGEPLIGSGPADARG